MLNNTITLLAAVEREPFADAIVDSDKNINYKELLKRTQMNIIPIIVGFQVVKLQMKKEKQKRQK